MDESTAKKVVCPNCSAALADSVCAGVEACPVCGCPLAASDGAGACGASAHVLESEASPFEPDGGCDDLVADLQEAFELDAEALRSPGPCRLRGAAKSNVPSNLRPPATVLPTGSRLGDFEIVGELGRGGMGIVYRARQVSLSREVALKVLPDYARHGSKALQRFRVEARAAARLHHTNIVPIYAQGEHNGHFYHAMELVDGASLDTVIHSRPDLLRSGCVHSCSSSNWLTERPKERASTDTGESPLTAPESDEPAVPVVQYAREDYRHVAALMAEVADALDCAHRHGVIHRDVKPHNLLLGTNNRLHLTDFGLARLTDDAHLTLDGEVMGTPAYLSPEQARGSNTEIDHRTDIYSLGVTLYEVLTRRKPFDGETRDQIITGICMAEPVAPRRLNHQIPVELETICLRAMEKEPKQRYPSAALLAEDLRRFSEGRPIRSRRISRLKKAARWVRGHKTLTTALAAAAAMFMVAVGLGWSARTSRHHEAQRLLSDAYDQLSYVDYRAPEQVTADVDRAAELGADATEVHLVQALACLGVFDQPGAIRHLEVVLEDDPSDLRAWYLLAWAQWRNGERASARATFDEGERARLDGVPMSADTWFFRGLAIHFDEPAVAVKSYGEANALRARDHAIYPQAVLHLARARNQRLYTTRSLEPFVGADASLRQLIEHEQYGAYPYYLLSITHRLAAEIHQGSRGTSDDSLVAGHYAKALEWARRGQEVEPDYDRPVAAEAECLESMGRYLDAIEARTHAIELAAKDIQRWESYHYRWRLHYWTGALEAALDDVTAAADYDPQCRFYAHVYPALIFAEMGDMPAALAHARAPAAEAPEHAQDVLWSATCLRMLGQTDEADALLDEHEHLVDFAAGLVPPQSEEWVQALYAYCREGGELTALDALAEEAPTPWRLWGEAHFHAAAMRLAEGDREAAFAGFMRAYRSFDGERRYTYHAKLICIRMQQDPSWPAWIPAFAGDETETPTGLSAEQLIAPSRDKEGGLR